MGYNGRPIRNGHLLGVVVEWHRKPSKNPKGGFEGKITPEWCPDGVDIYVHSNEPNALTALCVGQVVSFPKYLCFTKVDRMIKASKVDTFAGSLAFETGVVHNVVSSIGGYYGYITAHKDKCKEIFFLGRHVVTQDRNLRIGDTVRFQRYHTWTMPRLARHRRHARGLVCYERACNIHLCGGDETQDPNDQNEVHDRSSKSNESP